jgi:hypothetical protein
MRYATVTINIVISALVAYIGYLQYTQSQRSGIIEERQEEIMKSQRSTDMMGFVREYINGYSYLYAQVRPCGVDSVMSDLRRVGLPAIAVPSQYSVKRWLVITHSLGDFEDRRSAEEAITEWKSRIKGFESEDKSKTKVFNKYEHYMRNEIGLREDLVFRYKADVVTHRDYFVRMSASKSFRINVSRYARNHPQLRSCPETRDSTEF